MPNTFLERWHTAISRARAPICVGLDPDPSLLPPHLAADAAGLGIFLSRIVEATRDAVAAYKPNLAFFEAYGPEGLAVLESLRNIMGPDVLLIADAKRGDVLHTNEAYARALFGRLKADAVTVQPYLGGEPLQPFCREASRGMFVLCATSNPGAGAVQNLPTEHGPLYLEIARQAATWSLHPNVGLVVGSTKPEAVEQVVHTVRDLPLLLPGGGAQGGETLRVHQVLNKAGATGLFTFSRSVIYASKLDDFADAARTEVLRLQRMFAQ
ncbi:MAG TPA: orotidine-5'-phosphate decarboxylase [bacterium]